jgi:hypothetical protein
LASRAAERRRSGLLVVLALCLPVALAGVPAAAGHPRGCVTRGQLALMVLPKAALGADAARLVVYSPTSGFVTNRQAAEHDFDPGQSAAALTRQGRVVGYELDYFPGLLPAALALRRRAGLIFIVTRIDLWRDDASAAHSVARLLSDLRRLRGKPVGGFTLKTATFRVPRLGSADGVRDAVGVRDSGQGRAGMYYTHVQFRLGRLIASVEVIRADTKNAKRKAILLASALAKRMRGVLRSGVR